MRRPTRPARIAAGQEEISVAIYHWTSTIAGTIGERKTLKLFKKNKMVKFGIRTRTFAYTHEYNMYAYTIFVRIPTLIFV